MFHLKVSEKLPFQYLKKKYLTSFVKYHLWVSFSGNFANMRLWKLILCFSCDHIVFNFSIAVLWHPLVFELIYERICKNIEKIQTCSSKLSYILTWGMGWNELEPPETRWDQQRTLSLSHTHTPTHTNHRRVLRVQYYCLTEYNNIRCIIRTQRNIYDGAF